MNKTDQLFFSALLIPTFVFTLIGDYSSAIAIAFAPIIVFVMWYYREEIRGNKKLMSVLDRIF
jgi:hypothetical protein